jgi:predicted phosphodiesterase
MNKVKLQVVSDLHLDFSYMEIENVGSDALVVAGDLCELRSNHTERFFKHCSGEFEKTFFVMGNHEYYGGRLDLVKQKIHDVVSKYPNITVLDDSCVEYKGITFVGGTLWTDCNKFDPLTLHALKSMMWDFTGIKMENGLPLKPADTVDFHKKTVEYIKHVLQKVDNAVVVTHHSPSLKSIHERYIHQNIMNGGFHSDLSELILSHPQIKMWIHGHTHFPFDYTIGETRIVCNPRGYVREGWSEHDGFNLNNLIGEKS